MSKKPTNISKLYSSYKASRIKAVSVGVILALAFPVVMSEGLFPKSFSILLTVLFVGLFAYEILLVNRLVRMNFTELVERYIGDMINASELGQGSIKPEERAVFEKLAANENVVFGSITAGVVNNAKVKHFTVSIDYFPERKNQVAQYSYAVFDFELAPNKKSLHVYLDSKKNSVGLNFNNKAAMKILRSCISQNKQISLEGDFDEHFELYANSTTNSTALTTLTPDVMEKLIDLAKEFDVEFINNRVRLIADSQTKYSSDFLENFENVLRLLETIPVSTGLNKVQQRYLEVRRPPLTMV